MLHPLEIPRSKTKTHENSTCFYLHHPYKFNFCPWKFRKIQTFTLVKLCYTFWSSLEIALLFQLTPRISTWYFFNTPGNSMSSTPLSPAPVWISSSLSLQSFWKGENFEEGLNHPRMKLWFRGEEVLIKKFFI